MCYACALELQQQGEQAAAQQLYNRARQLHDQLAGLQMVTAFDSTEFIQCIAASREAIERERGATA